MSQKQLTSKQESKVLQDALCRKLDSDPGEEFYDQCQELKPQIDVLEREIVKQSNLAKEKDNEWMKWLIVIAAGVFSVIVTQVAKMSSLSLDQLLLLKIAISANALGIVFGAIYLYTDVINAKDLGYQLQVQRNHLLLKGKKRYEANAIYSRKLWFTETSKNLSLLCFLAVIVLWVWFVWQMQTDVSPIVNNPQPTVKS